MTKMKIALVSLFALGFATSAFASDSGLDESGKVPQAIQQQANAYAYTYAYAPAVRTKAAVSNVAARNFVDRVPVNQESAH